MSDKHYVHQPDETELARILRESRGWFEAYGTTLIYALSAVLAVIAIVVFVQRRPPATAPASTALLLASSVEDYQDLADRFPDTEIGTHARLRQADLQTNSAIGKMFTDRAVAKEELEAARKAYDRLIDRKDLPADVRERVLAGLARVTESQCDGSEASVQAAIAAWQKLLDEYSESTIFKTVAEERIASLKRNTATQFYTWFSQQDPKPGDDLLLPQDRPQVPDIPNAFELPDFGIPSSHNESPSPSLPSAGGETPASNPAETSDPPSADPVPAEPTPAEPTPAEPDPAEPATSEPPAASEGDSAPSADDSPGESPKESASEDAADTPSADVPATSDATAPDVQEKGE